MKAGASRVDGKRALVVGGATGTGAAAAGRRERQAAPAGWADAGISFRSLR